MSMVKTLQICHPWCLFDTYASNSGTTVFAFVDRETLHTAMNVQDYENILVTQVVGHSIE